jgi:hypothetical protein
MYMKKHFYTLVLIVALCGYRLSAQTYCMSFDSCTISDSYTRDHAFNILGNGHAGCLSDWEVTNGTPSLWRSTDGQGNAYDGTQMILEGVNGDAVNSEGVAVIFNFQAGKSYTVSLARRNSVSNTHIRVDYVLLDSAIAYTYNYGTGGSPTPAIPGTALVAYSDSDLTSSPWQVLTFTTPVLAKNYTRLWFRASWPSYESTCYLLLDSICIQQQQQLHQDYCMSFDSCVISDSYTRDHAFNILGNGHAGCLSDWEVTNGTPSIWRSTDGQGNAYDGTQMILEGVNGDIVNSEGVALKFNFQAGNTYTVSLARRNSVSGTDIRVDYVLLDSAIAYTYNYGTGGSPTPAIPSGALVAYTDNDLVNAAWQVLTFTTPVLAKNYTRLWFRASWPSYQSTAYLLLDDICISSPNQNTSVTDVLADNKDEAVLFQNTSNPFSNETTIGYFLPLNGSQHGYLQVYDITGKALRTYPVDGNGRGTITMHAENMPAGMYLYSLVVNGVKADTKRMMIAH